MPKPFISPETENQELRKQLAVCLDRLSALELLREKLTAFLPGVEATYPWLFTTDKNAYTLKVTLDLVSQTETPLCLLAYIGQQEGSDR